MPDPTSPKERRFFLCTEDVVPYSKLHEFPGRHIIGELVTVTLEGERVTAMALWDVPKPTDEVPPVRPKVRARQLAAVGIGCVYPDCNRMATWRPGQRAFSQLMKRYGYKSEPPILEEAESVKEAVHEPV